MGASRLPLSSVSQDLYRFLEDSWRLHCQMTEAVTDHRVDRRRLGAGPQRQAAGYRESAPRIREPPVLALTQGPAHQ